MFHRSVIAAAGYFVYIGFVYCCSQ